MVTQQYVDAQLRRLGLKFRFIGRAEIAELANILLPGEQIQHCVTGFYGGSGALLCATDRRLLLVDKRLWFLNVEDIGYDMITEVNYTVQIFDAYLHVITSYKQLNFRSWSQGRLHKMGTYMQERIVFLKHHMFHASEKAFNDRGFSAFPEVSEEKHFFFDYPTAPVDPNVARPVEPAGPVTR